MILDIYWAGVDDAKRVSLATICKELNADDYVIFITTTQQEEYFRPWLVRNELVEGILLETPFITNGSHPEYGRRIKITILSKPRKKDE